MYPRGGACTVTVAYPTYGFAAEKDIPKVVSDSEINPTVHKIKKEYRTMQYSFTGGTTRNRTGVKAFAELCLTAWLWCRSHIIVANFNKKCNSFCASLNNKMLKIYFHRCYRLCFDNIDKKIGAGDRTRTGTTYWVEGF